MQAIGASAVNADQRYKYHSWRLAQTRTGWLLAQLFLLPYYSQVIEPANATGKSRLTSIRYFGNANSQR